MKRTLVFFLFPFVMLWDMLEIMDYCEAILFVIHQSWWVGAGSILPLMIGF